FEKAVRVDSINVKVKKGKLIGYVSLKIEAEEAKPIHPVGVDLNETNAVVAVNPDNDVLFITGF
ncbi:MAG: Transposase, partial [Candidatus Alkanophagales archaeon MCA70_species_2]|nr:Transposase [Candidatus Alkanophaga liquidiphilum]